MVLVPETHDRSVAGNPTESIRTSFDEPDAAIGMARHGARLAVVAGDGKLSYFSIDRHTADPSSAASLNHSRSVAYHD